MHGNTQVFHTKIASSVENQVHGSLGPETHNGTPIGSAVFAQLNNVSNRHTTYRQSDRQTTLQL